MDMNAFPHHQRHQPQQQQHQRSGHFTPPGPFAADVRPIIPARGSGTLPSLFPTHFTMNHSPAVHQQPLSSVFPAGAQHSVVNFRHKSSPSPSSSSQQPSFIKRKSDVGHSSTKWHLRLVQQQQQQQQQQQIQQQHQFGSVSGLSHAPCDSPGRRSLGARISLSDARSFTDYGNPDGEDEEETGTDKVKEKLMSLWNNVKYGWNVKLQSNFNQETPIWLLGKLYHHNMYDSRSYSKSGSRSSSSSYHHQYHQKKQADFNDPLQVQRRKEATIARFKQDYYSRIWFTYRRQFVRIEGSQFTSDCGWGCMLRSGQMMLAQAFIVQYLGRDWRWTGSQSDKNDMIHRMILKWFLDEPDSPFSIHQLVKIGSAMGKKAGDWYGPATTAHVMTQALAEGFIENPILENIVSYVAQDCTVYIRDILKLCTENVSSRRRCSIVKREARTRASVSSQVHDFDLARMAIEAEAMTLSQQLEENGDADQVAENRRRSRSNSRDYGCETNGNYSDEYDDCDVFVDLEADVLPRSRSSNLNKASSTFNLYGDMSHTATSTGTSGYASMSSHANDPAINHISSQPKAGKETLPSEEKDKKWRGVVIYIPVRLGGEKFNPVYTECIKSLFAHPCTLGIIGGRPKHSLYFIGAQDDKLIYLDPHLCQDAVDVSQVNFPLHSFHCNCARKMPINKMDPSCTIAFHVRTRLEFDELIESVKDFIIPGQRHTDYPIFVFADGFSPTTRTATAASPPLSESVLRVRHRYIDSEGNIERETISDDFVLIS